MSLCVQNLVLLSIFCVGRFATPCGFDISIYPFRIKDTALFDTDRILNLMSLKLHVFLKI